MLLDVDLAKNAPQEFYLPVKEDFVFIGCVLNNLYDEKRITLKPINDTQPGRWMYNTDRPVHLYGFLYEPKGQDIFLIKQLKELGNIDLLSYSSLLNKYDYECSENYIRLQQKMFPVDTVYIQRYISEFDYNHTLEFKEEIPQFQQFTSFNMYFLIE
jgi:hypothetical protein